MQGVGRRFPKPSLTPRMLHFLGLATLPLVISFTACSAAHDERTDSPVVSDAQAASGTAPVALAQYPGAPFEDRDGNLWFMTVTKGLIRFDGEVFRTFTEADGLPSLGMRDLIQREDGSLWVATTGGVCVFDGTRFTTLTDYGDTPFTQGFGAFGNHRDVWDLMVDREGVLWCATGDGVFRFDGTRFVPFELPVVAPAGAFEFGPRMVYEIVEDRAGNLWFATDGAGAVRFDGTDMRVFTVADGLSHDRICTIVEDRRGDFWFGTSGGAVSRWDGSTFSTHLRSESFSEHTGWGRFMTIFEDRAGVLWLGVAARDGGVYRFDGEAFEHFATGIEAGTDAIRTIGGVPSIRETSDGTLWLGSTNGVFRREGERFVHYTNDA